MKTAKDNLIHIDEKHALKKARIGVDLVRKRVVKETGVLQLDFVGNYPSIANALLTCMDMSIGDAKSLQAVVDRIATSKTDVLKALRVLERGDKAWQSTSLFSPRLECLECDYFKRT